MKIPLQLLLFYLELEIMAHFPDLNLKSICVLGQHTQLHVVISIRTLENIVQETLIQRKNLTDWWRKRWRVR